MAALPTGSVQVFKPPGTGVVDNTSTAGVSKLPIHGLRS